MSVGEGQRHTETDRERAVREKDGGHGRGGEIEERFFVCLLLL